MKPDTIAVRIVSEVDLDADTADLTMVVEGATVFSGAEALRKAKELRTLVDALKAAGIDENRVKLRSVQINSQSFALIKASSAKYVVSIKSVTVELLPTILSLVASQKGAKLSRLTWNYGELKATRRRLRHEALTEALQQARRDAEALEVEVLGIHQLTEETRGRDYEPEHIAGDSAGFLAARGQSAPEALGFHLGNSTTVRLDLRAEFRVGPISTSDT